MPDRAEPRPDPMPDPAAGAASPMPVPTPRRGLADAGAHARPRIYGSLPDAVADAGDRNYPI